MFVKINKYDVCKAMIKYDNIDCDPEEVYKDYMWCEAFAVPHHQTWRTVKSDIIHDVPYNRDVRSDEYVRIRDELERMREAYGERSITFNTLVRAVSLAQLEVSQVQLIKSADNSLPPAFDHNMRVKPTKELTKLRDEITEFLRTESNNFLDTLKVEIRKAFAKARTGVESRPCLTNGTTTGIQWHGKEINDILGVVFIPENFLDDNPWYRDLARRLNTQVGHPDLIYIEIPKCEIHTAGGEHMYIPDKDGKIREVYRMFPWISVLSKVVHVIFDQVARNLPGNYTYKHKAWLKYILDNHEAMYKYIVGADMEKYSDTLDLSFIMDILKECGVDRNIVEDLKVLYSMNIYEPLHARMLTDLLASLQGQYGDFPFITIANLTAQAFIYHKLGIKQEDYYNAAVGDDTGLMFPEYDDNIMNTIRNVYGSIGVSINKTKTSTIKDGGGVIDFVKLQLDSQGIRPFLNMRTIAKNNIDSVIRDIMDLFTNTEKKLQLLEDIFGKTETSRLINTNIINGGFSDEPITKQDIWMYNEQYSHIFNLSLKEFDDTYDGLCEIERYLKSDYPDGERHYLCETLLNGWLSDEELSDDTKTLEELDELIKMKIMNAARFGIDKVQTRHYDQWLGKVPSEMRAEYDKPIYDSTKNEYLSGLWEEISSFDTKMAYRNNKHKLEKRKVSYMLPIINGMWEAKDAIDIPNEVYIPELIPKSLEEYETSHAKYMAYRNTLIYRERLKDVVHFAVEACFGNTYRYACLKDPDHTIYRLYHVSYHSKYELLPQEIFEEWKSKYLSGMDVEYNDFIKHFIIQDSKLFNQLQKQMNDLISKEE